MRILVTGSAGHLGEALMLQLREMGHSDVLGVDIQESRFTTHVGSVADRGFVSVCMRDVDVVYHTATLHKPHIATHTRQQFVETNITGTLNLLEEAVAQTNPPVFIFTSTTSVFGDALEPDTASDPAVWITEETVPISKNIYGVTKIAAENMCQLFHRNQGLSCIILRTSRFFPEEDDSEETRAGYSDQNAKGNEYLHRRVEIQDCVNAHLRAAERARAIGFGRYIISASPPFSRDIEELKQLRKDPTTVIAKYIPLFEAAYDAAGWKMSSSISRVYDNSLARKDLDWHPKYDFEYICKSLLFQHSVGAAADGYSITSPRAHQIGRKYYHSLSDRGVDKGHGPYPTDP
ncbi:unnamed protein product [Ectocarpus fasciculatus]